MNRWVVPGIVMFLALAVFAYGIFLTSIVSADEPEAVSSSGIGLGDLISGEEDGEVVGCNLQAPGPGCACTPGVTVCSLPARGCACTLPVVGSVCCSLEPGDSCLGDDECSTGKCDKTTSKCVGTERQTGAPCRTNEECVNGLRCNLNTDPNPKHRLKYPRVCS